MEVHNGTTWRIRWTALCDGCNATSCYHYSSNLSVVGSVSSKYVLVVIITDNCSAAGGAVLFLEPRAEQNVLQDADTDVHLRTLAAQAVHRLPDTRQRRCNNVLHNVT